MRAEFDCEGSFLKITCSFSELFMLNQDLKAFLKIKGVTAQTTACVCVCVVY